MEFLHPLCLDLRNICQRAFGRNLDFPPQMYVGFIILYTISFLKKEKEKKKGDQDQAEHERNGKLYQITSDVPVEHYVLCRFLVGQLDRCD